MAWVEEPISVVNHHCLALAEFDKAAHLLFEAFNVVLNCFFGKHLTKVASAGRVADHACAAAKKGDGSVTCHLKALHKAKSHKVTDVKAVSSGVKADVKNSLAVVDKVSDFLFVCYLSNKSSCYKFFINLHY